MTNVERDLSQSIGETLVRAAHRSEQRVAWIRALNLSIVTVLGAVTMRRSTLVLSVVWTVLAWTIVAVKRHSGYHRWAPWATTALDGAMVASYTLVSDRGQPMLLAATALVCTIIAITGAIRLERWWLWITTGVAMANVALAAAVNGLSFVEGLVLCLLIGMAGLFGSWLSRLSARAIESEVQRIVLGRFLPPQVLDAGYRRPLSLLTQPRAAYATVLVTDIRSFTTFAETLPPAKVLAFLNEIQGTFAAIVQEHGGTVDKFMGDGMLAVFGAPQPLEKHAACGIAAAVAIERAARDMGVAIGIGVHSGHVITGCLGNGARLELTVIGDTVNVASRLESMTKTRGVTALISDAAVARAGSAAPALKRLGSASVRGHAREVLVYTLAA